ncbi:lipid kinase, YegS/Rv2252/BmrU family [Terrimicrobium sacchariphilum]|jgi:diacylglycerol kinase (ATP)|uniref:Lipid kinase, YegS/Rv2252/BmrU family n=2 Tax=Terrimicrobium sacchariphilum TaxID=690879 RepID=A0A146GBE0_TERSA|nr:lipid kinase, YegS/Rv2252/BmrU family [Terrimicrobium sacchariphilum]
MYPTMSRVLSSAGKVKGSSSTAVLIVNEAAGKQNAGGDRLAELKKRLSPRFPGLEVRMITPDLSADQIAGEAMERGVSHLLVGGGDGTVSVVARTIVRRPVTLGIIPLGTYNNIARSLNIPPDIEAACRIICEGQERPVDVGIANDERYFFEAAGAGLDAALFPLGEEIKTGRWGRILQFARLTMNYSAQRMRLEFDSSVAAALPKERRRKFSSSHLSGNSLVMRALLVAVANGPYYGSGFAVAPAARLNDGKLTVAVFRRFSKYELIRHFISISQGRRHFCPKLELFSARRVKISAFRKLPVHLDGVPYGGAPIRLEAVPEALRVIAPQKEPVA